MLEETYDVREWDEDRIERGDSLPDGWYHCEIEDVSEDASYVLKIDLKVIAGPYAGRKFSERLSHPEMMQNENAKSVAMNRRRLFAMRLGLLQPGTVSQVKWINAIGSEVRVKVATRKYRKKDNSEGRATGVTFDGIHLADSPKLPPEAKAEPASNGTGGAHTAGTTAGTAAGATSRRTHDFGDL